MKSFRKLRGFASLHKQAAHRNPRDRLSFSQSHELAKASQDMLDMKDCYDSLLSAAAGTANCAFGTSSFFSCYLNSFYSLFSMDTTVNS
ncbi:hypothetical protein OIU84_003731 [Salix udensis]|uniref:Uncharacterized protein n=1 Tax=Salix udensis TaxID=889485 RepID=A0AAD6K0H5_9ROSI|nr:hypothetical protein OIU84_003731 [Salix udensis]